MSIEHGYIWKSHVKTPVTKTEELGRKGGKFLVQKSHKSLKKVLKKGCQQFSHFILVYEQFSLLQISR